MLEPALAFSIPLWLQHGIETYGYWVILVAVMLESLGIPFPAFNALQPRAGGTCLDEPQSEPTSCIATRSFCCNPAIG